MPSAIPNGTAPRIPAWQRLGLKLKAEHLVESDSPKRKQSELPGESSASKKVKTTDAPHSTEILNTPQVARRKSVAFTPETKTEDGDSVKQLFNTWVCEQKEEHPDFPFKSTPAFDTPQPVKVIESIDRTLNEKERRIKRVQKLEEVKVKKTKTKKTKVVKPVTTQSKKPNSAPFLVYLKTYHEDRANWKFNKAHQNHLLKHIFDVQAIPSEYAHQVYAYVRGLQGAVRTRLRDEALAIKIKDLEPDNMEGISGEEGHAIREKRQYDEACKDYVANMTVLDASTKMGYEEGVLAGLSDFGMARRMAKRARAEVILAEFANEPATISKADEEDDREALKRKYLTDGSAKKVARKRKQRTRSLLMQDSSSEETSDSDSDSSASGSSTSGSGSDSDSDSDSKSDSSSANSEARSNSSSSGSEVAIVRPAKTIISISDETSEQDSSDSSSSSSSSSSGPSKSDDSDSN